MGDSIKDSLDCGVCVLASVAAGKIIFAAVASKKALEKGIHAGKLVGEIAKIAGGGGGGKPESAQAGGKDISKVDDALKAAADIAKSQIK